MIMSDMMTTAKSSSCQDGFQLAKSKYKKGKLKRPYKQTFFIFPNYIVIMIQPTKKLSHTVQKMKFSINDFFSKCDQICSFLQHYAMKECGTIEEGYNGNIIPSRRAIFNGLMRKLCYLYCWKDLFIVCTKLMQHYLM